MARRRDLSTFAAADRQALVDLMLQYLTDSVVNAHTTITHSGEHLFTGHRAYIEDLEAFLASRGAARFVPLPKWDPATPIPGEFNVVRPRDDGTARTALVNLNPNMPLPSSFGSPALCSHASAAALGNAINGWHGSVHLAVGGAMSQLAIASAAPIFWPWHAFLDDVYDDYLACRRVAGWVGPVQVPGWFGWENQGGGVAVADLHGHGVRDLMVFHVDNPRGENRGYYRVGGHLNAEGNVEHGWSDPKAVPGWFGEDDQAGDVAVADLNGNGRPDLVVFHLDNPARENRGYYRIGWNLDSDGNVGGGWTNPMLIPGWFGWESQGGGIALADVSRNGRPDLIVFHIDNPRGENRGYYRIGWDLDTSGAVTGGWSAIFPVPGWFGWENQGGGISIADINANGQLDLIVFHLDNPAGDNHGYYRVGWNLGTNGVLQGGWTAPRLIPGWFGWENQGGGVTLADLDGSGRPDLIAFHIDNPGGDNHGYYRIGRNLDLLGNVSP